MIDRICFCPLNVKTAASIAPKIVEELHISHFDRQKYIFDFKEIRLYLFNPPMKQGKLRIFLGLLRTKK